MVSVSTSYSSVLWSKLTPMGSYWNNNAAITSNNSPYSALSRRRFSKISSRVLAMGIEYAIPGRFYQARPRWRALVFQVLVRILGHVPFTGVRGSEHPDSGCFFTYLPGGSSKKTGSDDR